MPVNPLIALQARAPDAGSAIARGLGIRDQIDTAKDRRQKRKQAKKQRSVDAINQLKDAELSNAVSLSLLGEQIAPMLESGDTEGVRSVLTSRLQNITNLGGDSTQTQEALTLLDSDPDLLLTRSKQAIDIGNRIKGGASERFFQPTEVLDAQGNRILIQASSSPDGKARVLDFKPIDKVQQARDIEDAKIKGREGTQTGQTELTKKQLDTELAKLKLQSQKKAIESPIEDAKTGLQVAQSLLENPSFNEVFGFVQGRLPALTQGAVDADADRERLVNIIALAQRGKLKGTGPISDFEGRQLARASTILEDRRISDEKAKEAVNILIDFLSDKAGVEPPTRQQKQQFRSSTGIVFEVE